MFSRTRSEIEMSSKRSRGSSNDIDGEQCGSMRPILVISVFNYNQAFRSGSTVLMELFDKHFASAK